MRDYLWIEAYDPGQTTGFAYFKLVEDQPLELINSGQLEGGVHGFLERHIPDDPDIVIAEQFVLDGRTVKPDLEPLKIEGVLIADAYALEHELVFQRNNFKAHVTDELLKRIGWYSPGKPHAMDAVRHGLAWAKTNRHMPTLLAYFQ